MPTIDSQIHTRRIARNSMPARRGRRVRGLIFAAWVLTRKRVLLGSHQIVAGRLAVAFSTVFVIGAVAVGWTTSSASPYAAAVMGAVMLSVAVTMLARAKRQFAQLSKRRDELQQLLGQEDR